MLSVKDVKELQRDAKARKTSGLFITEGIKMYKEAPVEDIEAVFVSESFMSKYSDIPTEGKMYEILSDSRFAGISDTRTPQGILTVMHQKKWTAEDILSAKDPFVLVLENLQDPGNAGTILRTAESAGVDGVFLTEGSVDMYNPKTIRSTMGSIYRTPHLSLQNEEALTELLETFMVRGIRTYAAYLSAPATYLGGDYREGTAFLIGNESRGLSEKLANLSDRLISIPMKGRAESLNAAMAAGILMYEAARQRG